MRDLNQINFHPPYVHKLIVDKIPLELDGYRILDIGCGMGDLGYLLRTRRTGDFILEGFDRKREYVERIPSCIYNHTWTQDLMINQGIPENHISLCCEVIEHISKQAGARLLENLDKKTGLSIITTPMGYMKDKNHLCGWTREEFEALGYTVESFDRYKLPRSLKLFDRIRRRIMGIGTGKFILCTKNNYEETGKS